MTIHLIAAFVNHFVTLFLNIVFEYILLLLLLDCFYSTVPHGLLKGN